MQGTEIALRPSVMGFITMNPGYPGRAELPESLKARGKGGPFDTLVPAWLWAYQLSRGGYQLIWGRADLCCGRANTAPAGGFGSPACLPQLPQALFRPVSMAVPDLALICEIMLMAEGFQQSKLLSRKFIILYKLCEDLLSKARHYDWKLRAIKTTLYVAGGMKRAAPELSEDKVGARWGPECSGWPVA